MLNDVCAGKIRRANGQFAGIQRPFPQLEPASDSQNDAWGTGLSPGGKYRAAPVTTWPQRMAGSQGPHTGPGESWGLPVEVSHLPSP